VNTTSDPFYIVGATGSGKSAVAVELALRCDGEIINADAYQLYEGLEIVTAKPTPQELAAVPHHLYGTVPTDQNVDAAMYESIGRNAIADVASRGKLPIVVGGSGLYVKTLTHGLSPIPASEPTLRAELEGETDAALVARLEELDPAGAAITNLKNRRYVIRALEITILGGRPMSEQKNEWASATPDYRGAFITREREQLYQRINARTLQMFELGLVEEVRALGQLSETAGKAIGVREVRNHLAGEIDLPTCIANIQQTTRRFAKRQMNWFRRESQFTPIEVSEADSASSVAQRIYSAFSDLQQT